MDTYPKQTTPVEPVKTTTGRRRYSKALKRQIVEECLTGHDSASIVARRHDINANLLFKWRRQYEAGAFRSKPASPALMPIVMKPPGPTCPPVSTSADSVAIPDRGTVEIYLAGGHRLVVAGAPCPVALRTVLEVLSR